MIIIRPLVLTTALAALAAPAGAQVPTRPAPEGPSPRVLVVPAPRELPALQRGRGRVEPRGTEVTDEFTRTVRLPRDGSLELSNVTGDIVITGGGGDDVRIRAVKRVRHANEAEARAMLDQMQVVVAERGSIVEVRTEYPRRRDWSGAVEYTVSLPNRAAVSVRSVAGSVRVTNVRGEVRAESVSGDIVAASVGRVRALKSVSGEIRVTDANGEELSASTVSGAVIARNVRVQTLETESVSGPVRFTDVSSDRARIRSFSGSIEYSGRLARSGRYDLQSHSGSIRITPASNQGFDLEARTFSGNVRSDLPLKLRGDVEPGARRGLNRTLRGVFGDGGAILSLSSFSGDIVIAER